MGTYPEKTIIQKDTCTPVFIAALFTIPRKWKWPKYASTEKWIKKWHDEYYSAKERNKIMQFVETWMDLETATQSQASQKEKGKYCVLKHTGGIQKNGIYDLIYKAGRETHK